MGHGYKEKNLKLEIKKMSFKNIILICETETNLKKRKSFYLLSKIKKIINKYYFDLRNRNEFEKKKKCLFTFKN